jgi:hypothetical protein
LETFVKAARRGQPGASPTTLTVELDQGRALPGPEWWERLAARWTGWCQHHRLLAAPMEQAREAHLAASALHSEEPFWAGPILTMDRRSSALLSGVLAGRSAP